MTPAQFWNPYTWWLPGSIAASDCYTQWLISVQNAWTDLYNQAYLAGPPQQTGTQTGQTGQTAQQTGQNAQQQLPIQQ